MCYDVENGQVSSRLNTISDFQVHATTVLTNTGFVIITVWQSHDSVLE